MVERGGIGYRKEGDELSEIELLLLETRGYDVSMKFLGLLHCLKTS